jgi:mannose-6-phosphate isomerase-like protein (cupin superfamily)
VRAQRPWGVAERLCVAPGYRVELLSVNPGAAFAAQIGQQQSGSWLVVQGSAEVTLGGQSKQVAEGQSIGLAAGQSLRLRNAGTAQLQVVEVRIGGDVAGNDATR